MQQGHKKPRCRGTTISGEEEDIHNQYRRVELKTAVISVKNRTGLSDSQEEAKAEICEESNQDVWRVAEGLNVVEVSVSSRAT